MRMLRSSIFPAVALVFCLFPFRVNAFSNPPLFARFQNHQIRYSYLPVSHFGAPRVCRRTFLAATCDLQSLLVSHGSEPVLPIPIGSSLIMLTIVGLLYTWETTVEFIREKSPSEILPVFESILAEMGGLGFIGLILQTVGGSNREFLHETSVTLFGEEDILLESFEFLHSAFFQVGVAFFLAVGVMVVIGLQKLDEIKTIQELQTDEQGFCTATPEKLIKYLPVDSGEKRSNCLVDLWNEITMSTEERAAKTLLMRHRLVHQFALSNSFRIEKYVQNSFARNLLEISELSPLTWVYLIPALSLANAVDLSHDVINASSPNALASTGFFFSTPTALIPSALTVLLSCLWGAFNCWKMTRIKYMLIPRLEEDKHGAIQIIPPLIDTMAPGEFISTPNWVHPIEAIWAQSSITNYERLFGTAGAAGPDLYRNSIKFQTWLCITHVVFFAGQILPRDLQAMMSPDAAVGDPANLRPEFIVYSGFVLLSLFQLIFVSPRSFWNFCLVECMEDGASETLLMSACSDSDQ